MNTYLMHYGILGQKWGVRRFQNPDGSLTEEGRARYLDSKKSSDDYKYLNDSAQREFFKGKTPQLTRKGQAALSDSGRDSELGKTIRAEQMDRQFRNDWNKPYNRTVDRVNPLIPEFNKKWEEEHGLDSFGSDDYYKAYKTMFGRVFTEEIVREFGSEHPFLKDGWQSNVSENLMSFIMGI